jgi:mono/diheme cytochrome c family protein
MTPSLPLLTPAARSLAAGLFSLALLAGPALAQDQLSGGARIYFQKGQCNQCHGKFGDGVGDDPREHGANFRESSLDKQTIMMIVSCGIPGTNMPYFDKFSYTDDRCYGQTGEQLGNQKPQPPLTEFLAKHDIDVVADYVLQTFVGKGPVTDAERAAGTTAGAEAAEPQH